MEKKFSLSKIPGSLNLKFTFQFDHSSMLGRIVMIVQKNSSLENWTTKKMSIGSSSYYDGYGSYDCPKKFLRIQPLKEVKKSIFRELDNEENEHRT